MRGLLDFIKYNNAVPIGVSLVLLAAGTTFAATDPQAIYASQQQVKGEDNSYIVNADLSAWNFALKVDDVTEDADYYYVAYEYQTMAPVDYVWQPKTVTDTLKVGKKEIQGKDLGIFVSKQLAEVVRAEHDYLASVQTKEQTKGLTTRTLATTYSGLIGKLLDPTEEAFPGYTPVVPEAPQETAAVAQSGCTANCDGTPINGKSNGNGGSHGPAGGSAGQGGQTSLVLQVLGNNPAHLPLHSSYIDLGALLTDTANPNSNLGYTTYFNGKAVSDVLLDTSAPAAYTIEYHATDLKGVTIVARRIVLVGDAADPGGEISSTGTVPPPAADTTSDTSASTTLDVPADTSTPTTPTPSTPADTTATTTTLTSAPAASDSTSTTTPADTAPAPAPAPATTDTSASATTTASSTPAPAADTSSTNTGTTTAASTTTATSTTP